MNDHLRQSPGRPPIYPWERWLLRKTPITLKPTDYRAKQRGMCVMIREKAGKFGVTVSVYPQEDGSIKIVPRNE